MFFVYFLLSLKNNKIYVGETSKDPESREKEHNHSSNKFTKNNKPWKLIYFETYSCEKCAKQREKFYKTGFGKRIKYSIIKELVSNSKAHQSIVDD